MLVCTVWPVRLALYPRPVVYNPQEQTEATHVCRAVVGAAHEGVLKCHAAPRGLEVVPTVAHQRLQESTQCRRSSAGHVQRWQARQHTTKAVGTGAGLIETPRPGLDTTRGTSLAR